ncbi:MAG TPA: hypothetical protein VHV08_17605, partial [Pirellulales bacterium]|nr:hypothetical protein [Pirellulales bacterium]
LYADDSLAHDIFSMTIDAQGRVVVAGAGYVKTLHDDDADGRADRTTLYSSLPASGAHGMVFDGPDLICSGDDSIMRLRDADGDGVADRVPDIWTALRHPEHGANGLVRGPDGCYYLVCGNDAGVSEKQISTTRSPVEHPRSGAIVRFSSQGKPLDVYAHGFRNPYDLDFDAAGHLLVVDSDGERDHHLPWYAPNRLFDVAQGMEHGWLLQGWARGWNRPASFFDNVERLVELGRGSPTGAVVYRHRAFPESYRGGLFTACWTLGRIYYVALSPEHATCRGKFEIFAETTSDIGFAPCDLAVGPQGDLFVAIGGRRTRGSVFRIHAQNSPAPEQVSDSPLEQVLLADQPMASWSRARWVPVARKLGKEAFKGAVTSQQLTSAAKVRAIEILVEVFEGPEAAWTSQIIDRLQSAERARLAWALGRGPSSSAAAETLARLTDDTDPAVNRAAWEALATIEEIAPKQAARLNWAGALSSRERRVRAAAIAVARRPDLPSYRRWLATNSQPSQDPAMRMAQLWIEKVVEDQGQQPRFANADFEVCLQCFAASSDAQSRLEAIRLLQLGLGDMRVKPSQAEVYTGYVANYPLDDDDPTRKTIAGQLAAVFPTPDAEVNRELARLMGMIAADSAALPSAIASRWTTDSSIEDDLHYLIVASLLPAGRTPAVTAATAACLLRLHPKLDAQGKFVSRNWPERVAEIFDELCRRDPALSQAIAQSDDFGHREHTLFVEHLSMAERLAAIETLWTKARQRNESPSAELVALCGKLPRATARPMLEPLWDDPGLRDPIVLALARFPAPQHRAKFIEALASPQPAVVEKAARALLALGIECTTDDLVAALRALKQACALAKTTEPRRSLLELLNFWTEDNADVDDAPDPSKTYLVWYEMFGRYYPAEAVKLKGASLTDMSTWKERLANVEWASGQANRGRTVFERRACHRCHEVNGHLGPALKGAVTRLSRDDLFAAIIDPNREVSLAFQTTIVATSAGQVYQGLVVYESPESTLLQTGP